MHTKKRRWIWIALLITVVLTFLVWQAFEAGQVAAHQWGRGPKLDLVETIASAELLQKACTNDAKAEAFTNSFHDTIVFCSEGDSQTVLMDLRGNDSIITSELLSTPFIITNGRTVSKQGFPFNRNLEVISSSPTDFPTQLFYFIQNPMKWRGDLLDTLHFTAAEQIQLSLGDSELYYALQFDNRDGKASGWGRLQGTTLIFRFAMVQ